MMKEQKRLLILLATLLFAGVYWLYDWQKGSYRTPNVPQAVVKPLEEWALTPLVSTEQAPPAEPSSVPEVKVERAWGRDPFELPDGIELVKKSPETEQSIEQKKLEPPPKVTCIFIKGSQKVATINDKNCCEGDMMGDEKLVEILPDRVILEKGKAKREILLEGGNVSVVKKVK